MLRGGITMDIRLDRLGIMTRDCFIFSPVNARTQPRRHRWKSFGKLAAML